MEGVLLTSLLVIIRGGGGGGGREGNKGGEMGREGACVRVCVSACLRVSVCTARVCLCGRVRGRTSELCKHY